MSDQGSNLESPRRRIGVGAIVCVFLALLIAGAWVGVRHMRHRAALADLPAVDVGKLDPAMAELIVAARQQVESSPGSGAAWGHYGNTLWAADLIHEATLCYGHAERFDPGEFRWPYLRGLTLERQDPNAAIESFRRAAQIADHLALPQIQLGELLLARGDLAEAETQFRRALTIEPRNARILLGLGRLAFAEGHIDAALDWTSRAASVDPSRRRIRTLLSQIHQQRGDAAAVEGELRVLESLPENVPYFEWPDPILAEVAKLKRDSHSVLASAQVMLEASRPREAIAQLEAIGGENARNVSVAIMLGKAYLRAGDRTRAEAVLLRARERDPEQPPVHYELGNVARASRQFEDAIAHYKRATELEPAYAIAHYYLASCQLEVGNRAEAIQSLDQVVHAMPQNLRARREMAKLLIDEGRIDDAIVQLTEIMRLDPNDAEAKRMLQSLERRAASPTPAP